MKPRYAALTNAQFLLAETIQTAQELQDGRTWEELRQVAQEARLYGPGKASSQLTVLNAVRSRLSPLTVEQLSLLTCGSLEQRQLVNLALITRQKKLLLDFLAEVVTPKWQRMDRLVTDADARAFLNHKAEQEPAVGAWSASVLQKTRGNLTRFAVDAGVLRPVRRGEFEIMPQYLSIHTREAVGIIDPQLSQLLETLK